MKKKLTLFAVLVLSLFILVGCSARGANSNDSENSGSNENTLIIADPARKIIYTAGISVKTTNLIQTTNEIKAKLVVGEDWVEKEELSANSNFIIFRIKTTRLNAFIQALQADYETSRFTLESRDVSLEYTNTSAKIASLEASRARLEQIKETANVNELIELERRISEIDSELNRLNSALMTYDSLIEYSTVRVYLHGPTVSSKPPTYGTQLRNSFVGGWNAVVILLKFLGRAIATLIPFLVIVIPVTGITLGVVYRKQIKEKIQKNKQPKEENITLEDPKDAEEQASDQNS